MQDADLSRAKLKQTQLDGTDFTGATLTGAYVEDWGITTDTNFDGVKCEYVYMRLPTKENPDPHRKPDNRQEVFAPGEFNLSRHKLIRTDLTKADLSDADLSNADLRGACLSRTQALGTNLTGVKIIGACLEDWHINKATKLHKLIVSIFILVLINKNAVHIPGTLILESSPSCSKNL
ncbi:pentapeptide repeat-containing protein [Nostoc sp. TCL240-02]|uniref:pentapeptide repeat-containing protein n=1 Tax=Nostoc sp. TCL240-02 TaxID=2572090 RepID=UPI00159B1A7A|nr:pentapeptide repeat-containing protein [Nostoc sp. TCL240-02]QKQ73380.1 pentapeptide repeat-containing protein [Nostoc sp. TCL240-02]